MFSPAGSDWNIYCIGDHFAQSTNNDAPNITGTADNSSCNPFITAHLRPQASNVRNSGLMTSPQAQYHNPPVSHPILIPGVSDFACDEGQAVRDSSGCVMPHNGAPQDYMSSARHSYPPPGPHTQAHVPCGRDLTGLPCWNTTRDHASSHDFAFMDYSMHNSAPMVQSLPNMETVHRPGAGATDLEMLHQGLGHCLTGQPHAPGSMLIPTEQWMKPSYMMVPASAAPDHSLAQASILDSMNATPRTIPVDITQNYNFHSGMSFAAPDMTGWLRRASNAGDRVIPRLDTTHLAPPTNAANATRSPTSASTVGSSSGRSARRAKSQLTNGPHPFTCAYPKCGAGFYDQAGLTHHARKHKPYDARRHECTICHARFQYRKDLGRHLPRHDPNARRYYCRLTGCKFAIKGFGRQDHLDRHVATVHSASQSRTNRPIHEPAGSSPLNHRV